MLKPKLMEAKQHKVLSIYSGLTSKPTLLISKLFFKLEYHGDTVLEKSYMIIFYKLPLMSSPYLTLNKGNYGYN